MKLLRHLSEAYHLCLDIAAALFDTIILGRMPEGQEDDL